MATLREIAELAGVSSAAVSLYMNGKGQGRISPEKQQVIQAAIDQLGYRAPRNDLFSSRPAISGANYTVGVFWVSDGRSSLLGKVIIGIQNSIEKNNLHNFNIVIHPYQNGLIFQQKALLHPDYDIAIIANMSEIDMQYLESIDPPTPIVLLNRYCERYHCVYLDNLRIGAQMAELVRERGFSSVSIFRTLGAPLAGVRRLRGFIDKCRELGILIPNEAQMLVPSTVDGGMEAAGRYLGLSIRPPVIFCDDDRIALGALYTLNRANVKIPAEVSVMGITLHNPHLVRCSTPSLTVTEFPLSLISEACMTLAADVIQKGIREPQHIQLDTPPVIFRESFL